MPNDKLLKLEDRSVLPLLSSFFFVLTFAIKAFTDGPYIRGEVSSMVAYSKYFTALMACFASFAQLSKTGEHRFVFEFNKLLIIVFLFSGVSILMQLVTGHFSTSVYIELFKLAMPMVLAYCILNAIDDDGIWTCMVCVLVVSLIGYFLDLKSQGSSFSSLFAADFDDFNSETESSGFAEIALMLVFYFAYSNKSKVLIIVSAIFSILTFKRLAMLTTVLVLMTCLLAPSARASKVPKKVLYFAKILTIVITILWVWLLLPQQESLFIGLFGKTPFSFTMGRSESLRYLYVGGFNSYGYGSANEVIKAVFGVPFEMDIAKIAIELSPLVACLFIWLFWDIADNKFWGFLIVCYFMLNMVTSDSLNSNFAFTLAYLAIGTVGSVKSNIADE